MARFYGKIGFVFGSMETRPGIWVQNEAVRNYYGDVMKRRLTWEKGEGANDNIKIANQFSIMADEYAEEYPEYDFASNKGYGSRGHIEALKKYGPTPLHRRSFIGNFSA